VNAKLTGRKGEKMKMDGRTCKERSRKVVSFTGGVSRTLTSRGAGPPERENWSYK